MRAKRSKQYRKLMHQYELAFNFREPYQVLLDAEIIQAAARFKMRLGQMLENTLHGKIKPMITQCCIRHLYDMEVEPHEREAKEAWVAAAKQAERRRCGHHELDEPLSALECILSVLDPKGTDTNKHRYVVATQDLDVRRRLREIPGVPLIYINRSVMILEPMGEKTEDVRERDERAKTRAGLKGRRDGLGTKRKRDAEDEIESGDEPRQQIATTEESAGAKKRKTARGPKSPNPLSMKKKTKDKPRATTNMEVEESAGTAGAVSQSVGTSAPDGSDGRVKRKRKRRPEIEDQGESVPLSSHD